MNIKILYYIIQITFYSTMRNEKSLQFHMMTDSPVVLMLKVVNYRLDLDLLVLLKSFRNNSVVLVLAMIIICSALISTPQQIASAFVHFGLHFDSGWTLVDEDKIEIGANTGVYLSGNNQRNRDCSINEFNDFVLPYSDIYLIQVPKGEEEYSKFLVDLETEFERPLVDAGGDKNTVADFLLDSEIIAFTAPDGKLPGPGLCCL